MTERTRLRLPWLVVSLILAIVALTIGPVPAQVPGTLTQQSPSLLDGCTAAANSATSAATITITPPAGQYVYLCGVAIENCAGPAAVAPTNPASITTTNLAGSPRWFVGTGVTAGLCQPSAGTFWPRTLKSAVAGTAVTFVLPTFAANQVINATVFYYFAP